MSCRPSGGGAGSITVDAVNEDFSVSEDNWLAGVWATLKARWWLVLGTTLIALIVAIVVLRGATYVYTSELRVYAAPSTSGSTQLPGGLGGLASLAGISPSGGDTATPFKLYLDGIRTREVAERMARDRNLMRTVFAAEWNPRTGGWQERRGFLSVVKRSIWGVLGLRTPEWHPPSAARLQDFIAEQVVVNQSLKSPLVSLTMDTADPAFGANFLTKLGDTVDDYLREKEQERTQSNIDYLSEKLRGVTFVEQRAALFAALSDQERRAMLANSRAPYAANPFGVATSSSEPTKPRQVPLLLAGLIGGLVVGTALALLLGARRRSVAVIESA